MNIEKVEKLEANLHEPNYHTTKFFTEDLLAIEMKEKKKEKEILMNKPVCLGISIL